MKNEVAHTRLIVIICCKQKGTSMNHTYPTLAELKKRHGELAQNIVRTPTVKSPSKRLREAMGGGDVYLKLELFQHTGSFKARGALSVVAAIPEEDRSNGITAVSAGNHAVAAAWAAKRAGLSAKVVLISSVNSFRLGLTKSEGAETVLVDDAGDAFAEAERLSADEGRVFVHPFEGVNTTMGAAGVGLELMEDVPDLDAVIVSIGGGGLISGVATAVKAVNPDCKVLGVEPVGADSMSRSLKSGAPETLEKVNTLADSLGAPMSLPYGFGASQRFVDDIALITDDQICAGLALLQEEAKLAVEPAAGAVLAAMLGPFRERLQGKKVGLVICGANIDAESYEKLLARGRVAAKDLLD